MINSEKTNQINQEELEQDKIINNEEQNEPAATIQTAKAFSDSNGAAGADEELCEDFISLPFEFWAASTGNTTKELNEKERKSLGKRLYKMLEKHDMLKYVREDVAFAIVLSVAVAKRIDTKKSQSV